MREIKAYPIWNVLATWNQNGYKNNGVGFNISLREGFFEADKWWIKYRKKQLKDKEPIELLKLEVVYKGEDVWYRTWFAHESLNYFDNVKDAFENFEKWLESKGYYVATEREAFWGTGLVMGNDGEEVCLMGADEKWRWKLCGCKECKKQQITVIKH